MQDVLLSPKVPATPEYIFEVLTSLHRLQYQYAPLPNYLTMDTPYLEMDLGFSDPEPWPAPSMYEIFGRIASEIEWKAAERNFKTIRDFCTFIAARMSMPAEPRCMIFGANCSSAAAFLSFRLTLEQSGIDVTEIAPSSPIAPYLQQHSIKFLSQLLKIAPSIAAETKVNHPAFTSAVYAVWISFPLGLIGLAIAGIAGRPSLGLLGFVPLIVAGLFSWRANYIPPKEIHINSIKTFRDLAKKIAKRQTYITPSV